MPRQRRTGIKRIMKTKNDDSITKVFTDRALAAASAAVLLLMLLLIFGFTVSALYESESSRLGAEEEIDRLLELSSVQTVEISRLESKLTQLEAGFQQPEQDEEDKELVLLGTFRVTHYCPCEKCCGASSKGITATGTRAEAGRTIAVDPSVIPFGTTVYIDGQSYVAEDTGFGINGKRIDVFMEDHTEALKAGVRNAEVYVESD